MREFEVGDPVLLTLDPPGPVGITEGLLQYQDMRFRISKSKSFKGKGSYYELKGCVSDEGIPYAITGDWMRPIRELKR